MLTKPGSWNAQQQGKESKTSSLSLNNDAKLILLTSYTLTSYLSLLPLPVAPSPTLFPAQELQPSGIKSNRS